MDKDLHKLYMKYHGEEIRKDTMTGKKYFISAEGKRVNLDD